MLKGRYGVTQARFATAQQHRISTLADKETDRTTGPPGTVAIASACFCDQIEGISPYESL